MSIRSQLTLAHVMLTLFLVAWIWLDRASPVQEPAVCVMLEDTCDKVEPIEVRARLACSKKDHSLSIYGFQVQCVRSNDLPKNMQKLDLPKK